MMDNERRGARTVRHCLGSARTAAVLLTALVALVAACGSDAPATYSGYRAEPPLVVDDVSLPVAAGGGEVAMPAPQGGLRVVYFGYTTCPDVCPTTMSDLRRALAELPEDERARIAVSVVTVDPERDTPEVLEAYVENFVPGGDALRTTDDEALREAASAFGANYRIETDEDGKVEVAHTAELYAIDDSGTVLMQWPFGTTWDNLSLDLRSLLGEVSP